MDGVIKFFTVEAGLFVRHLRYFSNIESICINQQIVHLLREAAVYIDELLENAEHMEMPEQDVVKLIFDFDERQFSLRRYLECRTCCELIALSTEEFEAHKQLKHTVQYGTNSLFSPQIGPDAESTICQNKMATTSFEADHNQNYITKCATQSDDEHAHPSYSDVISNNAPGEGLSRGTSPTTVHSSDELSESQARDISVDSGYGTSYLIKVRGLPWTTTKKDLREFFAKVHILNGLDGIHFITDDENNFGVAYIQLPTRQDYEVAQTYHRKKLDERYIEVLKANKQDFTALNDIQKSSSEDNVLRLEGLPWNSKENEIRQFFHGLKLDAIGLILDKSTDHTLEAFVRFETSDDFDLALKRNWKVMGNRHVKIFRSSYNQMSLRLNSEEQRLCAKPESKQISPLHEGALVSLPVEKIMERKSQKGEWQKVGPRRSKAEAKKPGVGFYMVMARGFQWKVSKKDVMDFFKGINILNGEKGINIMKNVAMEAYVELVSKNDVKKALALNNKRVDSRTVHVTEVDSKEYSRVASCILQTNDSKVIQIRGLPWSVDKAYIMKLFPTIKIPKHHIQIEIDENNRRTGYAFVEFECVEDYDAAFKTDFKAINEFIKLFKATKEQYLQTITSNKIMNQN
ncbi:G-rich sequence factor 1-like [Sitodiplosis mosellana]|uniref:G-rich sequence factor 1-like n=1 Tax=Sitodiplosis mosellana TaxID=263140 RepID=UPI002444D4F8|nr:G-rich sequence factor 1-like [Sitodiplosis mosellana]